MKTIEYRGGVVTFRVPSHWKEEYEPDGGGTFYEDAPETGTLRLNIITSEAPQGRLASTGYDFLRQESTAGQAEILRLPTGDGMKYYLKKAEEDGIPLNIHFWEIAHCVPPRTLYFAIFSWTVPTKQTKRPECNEDIQMIIEELKNIHFYPDL